MYFALYMYSMPVDLRFRRLRAQKVAVLVPTLRSISRETDLVHYKFYAEVFRVWDKYADEFSYGDRELAYVH